MSIFSLGITALIWRYEKMDFAVFRKNLRMLRTMNGFSQEEIAEKLYVARSTYSAYETGSKIPDLQFIDAACSFYDIGIETLLEHDISRGFLRRIYFDDSNSQLVRLMNDFERLSVTAKKIIMERVDTLLEKETESCNEDDKPK